MKNKSAELRSNHGSFSIPLDEYHSHKDFYDKYAETGCRIIVDEKDAGVMSMG
ncbi:MAG: hypothetical protein IKK01_08890 [Clostridia bacterium]|nr:hypothetical protein [Clostridia bacterium]